MEIPSILYGNYNDVLKKIRKIRKQFKKIYSDEWDCDEDDWHRFSAYIERLEMNQVMNTDLIIMDDSFTTRKISSAFFPSVFPNVLLFEESIDNSPIIKWYKEAALKNPWLFLSLIADGGCKRLLFDKEYAFKTLESLKTFWSYLTSEGPIYVNSIMSCLETKDTIKSGDGLFLWEQSLILRYIFCKVGVDKDDVNTNDKIYNLVITWDNIKDHLRNQTYSK
jgi:hypothetical protein